MGSIVGLWAFVAWSAADPGPRPGAGRRLLLTLASSTHFLVHLAAMFTISLFVVMWNNQLTPSIERGLNSLYQSRSEQTPTVKDVLEESLGPLSRRQRVVSEPKVQPESTLRPRPVRELVGFVSYPTLMVLLGTLVGGSIWGAYLTLTGLFARGSAETAFAALRLKGYRSFLRMQFGADRLTIYPAGFKHELSQRNWRPPTPAEASLGLDTAPRQRLRAELIAAPVVVEAKPGGT
jgi:hypothetical protein